MEIHSVTFDLGYDENSVGKRVVTPTSDVYSRFYFVKHLSYTKSYRNRQFSALIPVAI